MIIIFNHFNEAGRAKKKFKPGKPHLTSPSNPAITEKGFLVDRFPVYFLLFINKTSQELVVLFFDPYPCLIFSFLFSCVCYLDLPPIL